MPPRIPIRLPLRGTIFQAPPTSLRYTKAIPSNGPPQTLTQTRHASILSSLSDNKSAYHKSKRRGRGPSSGLGKTSGRGHKGQKQHGKVPHKFEGGQTPLIIVHGKRGFKNVFSKDFVTVPLTRIQSWVAQGRIDPTKPITIRELALSRCATDIKDGVKLLATSMRHSNSLDAQPPLTIPLNIVVSRASSSAIAAVEAAGGTVTTRYYTDWAIKKILSGKMDPMQSLQSRDSPAINALNPIPEVPAPPTAPFAEPALPKTGGFRTRLPDPTSRKDIEYYRDPANRGYLSHTIKEGEGPSLFFKLPRTGPGAERKEFKPKEKKEFGGQNRMW